ncbi:MAG: NosR/NirI family protein [Gammaproteobacteria bacterium]|nr:NosR/NirI family protein [Gammaproteobacteria bacterium]
MYELSDKYRPASSGARFRLVVICKPVLITVLSLLIVAASVASAASSASDYVLPRFVKSMAPHEAFPGADRLGDALGVPPVVEAFIGGKQVGYLFLNSDFVNSTGYSGKPIHQLIAIDMEGVIRQVLLVEHHEPIVLIGIPESRITRVLGDYAGLDIGALVRKTDGDHQVDIVTGATVTVMVMDDTILRSAIKVARRFGLGGLKPERKQTGPKAVVNMDLQEQEGWAALLSDGSAANLKLTLAQINEAFEHSGNETAAARPEEGDPEEVFIDLYAAAVSVPAIGLSVLGESEYRNLVKRLEPGQSAIALAGDGRYSFKGSGYVRGGIFDRFQIIQGDTSIRFHDFHHKRLRRIAADGAPDFKDVDIFRIPPELEFDPAVPWRLELLVGRETGPTEKAFLTFSLDYQTPDKYLILPKPKVVTKSSTGEFAFPDLESEDAPLWMKMWSIKLPEIILILSALGILTVIFFFQNWLVKRPLLADRVRIGFLIFTLFVIGWYANAQLSVVNILAVFNALVSGFDWSYFLMEPLIFILWGSVAAALLFWGRGPYCGWLCPFGALQELTNRLARIVKLPQITLPWGLHERLWALKYLIFLVLFGFSLHSLGWAERLAEVEPFKTAIILKFVREWPYVLFAVAMIVPGLFIERFYCRYLCPLGAALAIPGRLRMFAWLKRYKDCGAPCQRCGNECMVQAIHPEGNINVNECLYCLHCQVVYSDDHACPVMVQKRLKKERLIASTSADGRHQVEQTIAELKAKKETKNDTP